MKALLPLLVCLPLTSCIINAGGLDARKSRSISVETLEKVRPGSATEFVESLLGAPTTRSVSDEKCVIWRYEGVTKNTYILFEDGKVSKTWQD